MIKYLDIHHNKYSVIRLSLIYIFFFFITNEIEGQNVSRYPLDFTEVYVLKAKFNESLVHKKSHCIYKNPTKCILYEIKVTSVLYCPTNTAFDSTSLMNLQYIIAPIVYADSLKIGEEFLITAMPSTSNKYIALTRLLNMGVTNNEPFFYHKHAYLSGLIECKKKKKDLFDVFIRTKLL